MNVLVVAVLGSLRGGTGARLAMTVEALSRLADVHLFVVTNPDQPGPVPGAEHAVRVGTAHRMWPGVATQALRWATHPRLPDHLARLDLRPAAEELRRFAPVDRQLTWLCKPDGWLLARMAGALGTATVCDIDDLDDFRLRSLAALRTVQVATPPELAGVGSRIRHRIDAARWAAYRRTVARSALTVVCSDLERRRSGLLDAAVVPNGHPGGRLRSPAPPSGAATALFVGSYRYLPNLDGARWVAAAIAPELRRLDPSAAVRLVGDGPPEMRRLAAVPGVSWSGPVADVGPELGAASVALVPLRAGSGTRVKILEAWAHGLPVVSTPIGAEGLDIESGEELVIADSALDLARAVHEVSRDAAYAGQLAAAGHRRWREAHSPDAVATAVAAVVRRAVQSAARA
jgi:glycosyltransferase involved in cell wall biosynthesis